VFIIARNINTSESTIYQYLNGKEMSREAEAILKRLWQDLFEMDKVQNLPNNQSG
jgi:hypothetical protein